MNKNIMLFCFAGAAIFFGANAWADSRAKIGEREQQAAQSKTQRAKSQSANSGQRNAKLRADKPDQTLSEISPPAIVEGKLNSGNSMNDGMGGEGRMAHGRGGIRR